MKRLQWKQAMFQLLTIGLLKAVCFERMLALLASTLLPVRRCDFVLWFLWMTLRL